MRVKTFALDVMQSADVIHRVTFFKEIVKATYDSFKKIPLCSDLQTNINGNLKKKLLLSYEVHGSGWLLIDFNRVGTFNGAINTKYKFGLLKHRLVLMTMMPISSQSSNK